MDNAIIRKKLVESAGKLERQLDWYKRNKDNEIIVPNAWHYVNKEL